jgi:hypothetical protein
VFAVLCLQVTWMVAGAASRVRAAGVMGAGGQWQMAAAGQWAAQGALIVVAGRVVVATAGASGAAALAVVVAGVMGAGAVARVVRDGVGEAQPEGLCSNHLCGLTGCRAGRWVMSSQLVVLVGWPEPVCLAQPQLHTFHAPPWHSGVYAAGTVARQLTSAVPLCK